MKIIDAQNTFSRELAEEALKGNEGKLKWRMAPDQAFMCAKTTYSTLKAVTSSAVFSSESFPAIFSDTMLDIPVEIEWDFPSNTIQLRNESMALAQINNLPNATL